MRKLLLFLLFSSACFAQTTNFSWTLPIGARPLAMGEAATADGQDPSTLWWNPAGLTEIRGERLFAMQEKLFSLIDHNILLFTKNFKSLSTGVYLSEADFSQGLGFKWKEDVVILSLAAPLTAESRFSIGGNIKYGRLSTVGGSENLVGLDLGALFRVSSALNTGFMLQDIFARGSSSTGTTETFDPHVTLGISYKPDPATTFDLDFRDFHSSNVDLPLTIKVGAERWLDPIVAIRFGYILSDNTRLSRFTGGIGLVLGPWEIDYAFNPNPGPDTNQSLRLSATYRLK